MLSFGRHGEEDACLRCAPEVFLCDQWDPLLSPPSTAWDLSPSHPSAPAALGSCVLPVGTSPPQEGLSRVPFLCAQPSVSHNKPSSGCLGERAGSHWCSGGVRKGNGHTGRHFLHCTIAIYGNQEKSTALRRGDTPQFLALFPPLRSADLERFRG